MSRDEWQKARYEVRLVPLTDEEGGGWMASHPELGESAFRADAKHKETAIALLEQVRLSLYDVVVAGGQPVPMPGELGKVGIRLAVKELGEMMDALDGLMDARKETRREAARDRGIRRTSGRLV